MAMKHSVTDSNTPFIIDPDTRAIINTSRDKTTLMQYDHNSERFTFEVPRYIENHDMSLCDVIEVHYENTSQGTSVSMRKTFRGIQKIDDLAIGSEDTEVITFSWLVPETATMFAGALKFQLKFICYDNATNGIVGYKWHTNVNDDMTITAGLAYSEGDINPSTIVNLQSIEIVEIEGGIDIILDGIHYKLYNGSGGTIPTNVETTDNKVTTITESATHTQYPSAKAVRALFDSISNGSVPTIKDGDTGKIIEVSNGAYALVPVSSSAISRYIHNTIKTIAITDKSTDDQFPSAKAVYALFSEMNASVVSALNTDVEV